MTEQSGWGNPTPTVATEETTETETSEVGLTPEQKAERKEAKQRLKITCLSYAVSINLSADEIVTAARKYYSFVTGTKFRENKED